MTESQLKGSETTRDAMEEDLIKESAFSGRRNRPIIPGELARNHLQTSTNEKHRQAKVKEAKRRKSFLGQRRK